MRRVVTSGSVWIFDEAGRYQRLPRSENGRDHPEWGSTPGPLQDVVWHDHGAVRILASRSGPLLWIESPDESAPGDPRGVRTGPIVAGLDDARSLAEAWPLP